MITEGVGLFTRWGQRDLNPHDCHQSTDFHPLAAFAAASVIEALRIGLSLYPRLDVRVAPVESLHLLLNAIGLELKAS
jgi:hypothetical protein